MTQQTIAAEEPVDVSLAESELQATRNHISRFLQEEIEAADATEALVVLDGGLASTLTGKLAVEALGPRTVSGLVVAGPGTAEADGERAEEFVETELNVEYDVVDVEPVVRTLLEETPGVQVSSDASGRTAVDDAGQRLRAAAAYLVADTRDAIVLGSLDRTERLLGLGTKHGDDAVDCLPIGNLYTTQLPQLADFLHVPPSYVDDPTERTLYLGHPDLERVVVDPDTLDSVLALTVDGNFSPGATARMLGLADSEVGRIRAKHNDTTDTRERPPRPEELN